MLPKIWKICKIDRQIDRSIDLIMDFIMTIDSKPQPNSNSKVLNSDQPKKINVIIEIKAPSNLHLTRSARRLNYPNYCRMQKHDEEQPNIYKTLNNRGQQDQAQIYIAEMD